MSSIRPVLIWIGLLIVLVVPILSAVYSPFLASRHPVYIASSFAGMIALALMLVQPLLAGGYWPGLASRAGRKVHFWVGIALVSMVMAHVGGLWWTSAPDVIDALLFESPTAFSVWGVVAMWATFAAALLAAFRFRLHLRPKTWRRGHIALTMIVVIGSVIHALLIEGTMEPTAKAIVCALALAALTIGVMSAPLRRFFSA